MTEPKLPNIIYILADDMGYGDLSCLNAKAAFRTPNFDAMAAGGMAFHDAHSSSAVCTPSRYSILTGRYNFRSALQSGVTWGGSRPLIEAGRMTAASLLKSRGYQTACFGKWHLGWDWGLKKGSPIPTALQEGVPTVELDCIDYALPIKGGPIDHGFETYFGIAASLDMPPYVYINQNLPTAAPDRVYSGAEGKEMARPGPQAPDFIHREVLPLLTRKTLSYISEHARDAKPFFIYFPLPAPHTPILPAPEFVGRSGTNAYGDFVLMCDDVVGRVNRCLEENGIAENTLVIYTSDNGCSPMADFEELARFGHNPSHVFRGHKADIFEGGHRVPLLAKWPAQIPAGSVCTETVCLVDFLATVAEITEVNFPDDAGEDSVSERALWRGGSPGSSHREATVHHSINGSFSIRRGPWKLEFCPDSGGWSAPKPDSPESDGLPPLQLYRLDDDIGERRNRVAEEPGLVKELTALLLRYIREGRSTPGAPQPNTGNLEPAVKKILERSGMFEA